MKKTAWGTQRSTAGFTLIELIMVILLTSVLAMSGYHLMNFIVRNTFFLPNQCQVNLIAADALEVLAEGNDQAKGLRFSKAVTAAAPNQIVVTNQDNQTITYSLLGGSLFRTIGAGAATMFPYFKPANVTISGAGTGGALFTYYDSAEAVTAVPANVRRVRIDLIVQNGAGVADNYQGSSRQSTGITLYNI